MIQGIGSNISTKSCPNTTRIKNYDDCNEPVKDEPGDESSNSSPLKKTFSRKKKSRKDYTPAERQILVDFYMKDPNPNHADRQKLGQFHSF